MPTCLNIGCGTDYRDGYINIDGSSRLYKTDKIIDLNDDSLLKHFAENSVDFILANDLIEHFYHWQAVKLLKDFYDILKPSGNCEIRVPDAEYIIRSWKIPLAQKLTLLFGGQDIPQGDNPVMNASRKEYPHFFCHKYGWTKKAMELELACIGFCCIKIKRDGTNIVIYAYKSSDEFLSSSRAVNVTK